MTPIRYVVCPIIRFHNKPSPFYLIYDNVRHEYISGTFHTQVTANSICAKMNASSSYQEIQ
jgi:hypothetical protein